MTEITVIFMFIKSRIGFGPTTQYLIVFSIDPSFQLIGLTSDVLPSDRSHLNYTQEVYRMKPNLVIRLREYLL